MAILTIAEPHRRKRMALPHKILINGQVVGIMQTPEVRVQMLPASVMVTVQSMIPFISSSVCIEVREAFDNRVTFWDRERFWDILFGIDIVLWVVRIFLHLSPTANLIYHIFSDGFFILWGIRTWIIRKRYFHIEASSQPATNLRNATTASR